MNTIKTLSIRQPWAWLIVQGYKDIENRDWSPSYRGPLLIHAGKQPDPPTFDTQRGLYLLEYSLRAKHLWQEGMPRQYHDCRYGGIVGAATLVDVVQVSSSPWFRGTFGLVLADPIVLPFIPLRGQLGLFDVSLDALPQQVVTLLQKRKQGEA